MRRYDVPEPYEKLKALTRGHAQMSPQTLKAFVSALPIPETAKKALSALTPKTYIGNAESATREFLKDRSGKS